MNPDEVSLDSPCSACGKVLAHHSVEEANVCADRLTEMAAQHREHTAKLEAQTRRIRRATAAHIANN